MSIWNWLKTRWEEEAKHFTYVKIDADSVEGRDLLRDEIKSGEHYIKLTLAEMFLKNNREWFSAWHPAVYSMIKFKFGDADATTFSHVAGPSNIKDVDQNADASISLNHTVVPVVPFNGGEIEIEAGLVAVRDSSDVKQLLKLLTDVSSTLAVPQLSTALAFANPLVNAIEALTGSDKNKTVVRLHDSFSAGSPLRARYLAAIEAPAGSIPAKLFVKEDRLCSGADLASAKPLIGYGYVLFRVDALTKRDDWEELTAIKEPFMHAIEMLSAAAAEFDPDKQKSMVEEAQRRLGAAKLAAFRSKDLTKIVGRRQVVEALQLKFNEAKQLFSQGAAPTVDENLFSLAMARTIAHADAAKLGEMDESELYAS